MSLTIFFLQFLGLLFLVIGCSIVLHSKQYARLVKDLEEFSLAYYLSALLPLMLGLAMVLVHNVWGTTEEILVSVVGWLTLTKGLLRLLVPQAQRVIVRAFSSQYLSIAALLVMALGAWMTWLGFR